MNFDFLKKVALIQKFNTSDVQPAPQQKTQTVVNQQPDSSKTGETNFQGNLLKFRLQNTGLQSNPVLFEKTPAGNAGIFTDGYEGIGPVQANYVSPNSPDARPEEAASFIKYGMSVGSTGSEPLYFAEALKAHKNDPQWTASFLREMGIEDTANYIAGSFQLSNLTPEAAAKNSAAIRESLEGLVESGALTQESMDALVSQLKDKNEYVFTEIFAKSASPELKQMFVNSAAKLGGDKMNAAAALVLGNMSPDKQAAFLNGLGPDKLKQFINSAMAGQTTIVDLNAKLRNPNAGLSDSPTVTFGGIEKILQTASIETAYNGSTLVEAPFSDQLKVSLFNIVTERLNDPGTAEKFRNNVEFKQQLGTIYANNQHEITASYLNTNGYDLTSDGLKNLNVFFKEVLFTTPLAENASDIAASFTKNADAVLNDADNLSDKDFELKYGKNKREMSALVGQEVGIMVNAMEDSLKSIKEKSDGEAKQIVDVINGFVSVASATAGVPGAGATAGASIIGEALKIAIGSAADSISKGKYDDAVKQLKEQGIDPEKFDDFTINNIVGTIENDVAHDSFRDAYDFVKEVLGE